MRSIWHIIHGDPKFVVGEVQYQSSRWRQPCYVDIENEANELAKASKWIGLDAFFLMVEKESKRKPGGD
ncbi:hypothetical protein J31TS3_22930 [Paenibacillus lactis]|nr:hypothetical protein J31TS3_22930 [Paenibacillus lactis]